MADYLSDRPDALFNLLAESQRFQFVVVFNKLVSYKDQTIALAHGELARHPSEKAIDPEKEVLAKRQANAALALVRLGTLEPVWPLLRHTPDPTTRSFIIDRVANYGVDPEILWQRLTMESDASAKAALILSLGHYPKDVFVQKDSASRRAMMVDIYRNDVDPGVHGAAAWLLQHWNAQDEIKPVTKSSQPGRPKTAAVGIVAHEGNTMAIINGPVEFLMGSPPTSMGTERRGPTPCRRSITRSRSARRRLTARAVQPTGPAASRLRRRTPRPHQLYGVVPCG